MRKFNLILAATLAIMGAMVGERAQAAVVSGAAINANAIRAVADDLVGTERVQFYWGAAAIAGTKTAGTGRAGIGAAITGVAASVGVARLDGVVGAGREFGRDGQAS